MYKSTSCNDKILNENCYAQLSMNSTKSQDFYAKNSTKLWLISSKLFCSHKLPTAPAVCCLLILQRIHPYSYVQIVLGPGWRLWERISPNRRRLNYHIIKLPDWRRIHGDRWEFSRLSVRTFIQVPYNFQKEFNLCAHREIQLISKKFNMFNQIFIQDIPRKWHNTAHCIYIGWICHLNILSHFLFVWNLN